MINRLKNRNSLEKEINSMDIYIESIEDELLKKRIKHILDWYIRKSNKYRNWYYILSFILIGINASIPFITILDLTDNFGSNYQGDITTALLSTIATIITSSITLFSFKNVWFRYRKHVELIKRECVIYTRIRTKENYFEEENRLGERIEEIIYRERDMWEEERFDNKKSENKGA